MLRESLMQITTKDEYSNVIPSLTYTTNSTPSDNQWTFNAQNEVHLKDASSTVFGALRKDIYGLITGDILEIDVEIYSVSGALPKISLDGYGSEYLPSLINTEGYIYPQNQWKRIKIKYIVQKQSDYYRLVIGTFTVDIGEYKVRNLSIKVATQNPQALGVFAYSSGYTDQSATYKTILEKSTNGDVTFIFNGIKTDGSDFVIDSPIRLGTLPTGFIPKYFMRFPTMGEAATSPFPGWGICWMDTSGGVFFRAGTAVKNIGFVVRFPSK